MFDFEQIKDLIELVAKRHLEGVEIANGEFRLKIDGHRVVQAEGDGASTLVARVAAPPVQAVESSTEAAEGEVPADHHVITSPIVGTFYSAPSPDSPAFVQVGDRVKVGQVLCIVEAMKLMNEIESDVDGELIEIYPANAQAVEFGEKLFAVRES